MRPGETASSPSSKRVSGSSGREVELLLLREAPAIVPDRIWSALARPARILRPGSTLTFVDPQYAARVIQVGEHGVRHVAFQPLRPDAPSFEAWLARVGHIPLPPYIERPDSPNDRERYQTIFAREPGSVAAPTAGLHFTEGTLSALRAGGVDLSTVTLHVGPGTFRPVATEDPAAHRLDTEPYRVPSETAASIRRVREAGGRVVAVGTTSVRALESWALDGEPGDGAWRETGLFILPPFVFRIVDSMITNFHLPRSTLLMLVSAFTNREMLLGVYSKAVSAGYRFYSYGDAMMVF